MADISAFRDNDNVFVIRCNGHRVGSRWHLPRGAGLFSHKVEEGNSFIPHCCQDSSVRGKCKYCGLKWKGKYAPNRGTRQELSAGCRANLAIRTWSSVAEDDGNEWRVTTVRIRRRGITDTRLPATVQFVNETDGITPLKEGIRNHATAFHDKVAIAIGPKSHCESVSQRAQLR
jgi:hypothetical protein